VIERIGPTERHGGIAARSGTTADLPILLDVTLGLTDAADLQRRSAAIVVMPALVPAPRYA
jgi:hypothetical protein